MRPASTDDILRKRFRSIGLVLTVGLMGLTTMFAYSVTKTGAAWLLTLPLLAAVLIAADLGNCYLWPYVKRAVDRKSWADAAFAAPFATLATIVCLLTAFGSLNHVFGESVDAAKFQNTKLDDVGVTIAKEEANETIYVNRIAELSKANGGWVTTTTADALRAKLPGLELAIKQESDNCRKRCKEATKERDDVNAKIATLEQIDKTEILLKATREALARYREKRASTERGDSGVLHQNASLASTLTLSLKPTEASQAWTGRGVAICVVLFMVLGALGFNSLGYSAEGEDSAPRVTRTTPSGDTYLKVDDKRLDQLVATLKNGLNPA